ncbi:sugar ABC transporter ATP-binding protein [Helicovermis profundi]|uniref:Ribose ABC transporter ATP-binding protein RbsA n=1 Tax=Helicovermis profundi TaxID=3065157 RepID=A0AAU9E5B3_9FIRM|nr:ribose ABC transporter ATP-binding protein RbsA [Clostridia bacterium S502]
MNDKILEMRSVIKTFPGVIALDNVHLNVYKGKVMALLGENGAGKSTLMKILSGVYKKTSGDIYFKGKKIEVNSPKDAQSIGIAIIHQELNLIEELSIGENIFLGREPRKYLNLVDFPKLFNESKILLESLGINENPKSKLSELSIGKKQMIEIAKALSVEAELIIMDEPTDALTDKETESLFKVINKLIEKGKSIVYISHRLKEIFEMCDDVTVIRDGKFIAESKVSDIDEEKLIEMMVGRKLSEQYPYLKQELGKVIFEVKNLNNKFIHEINFNLKKGEILGVSGLMGSGRTELAKTIYGAIDKKKGSILVDGKEILINSEKDAILSGITYVSEDRKKDGLVLGMNVKENISLSSLKNISKFNIIDKKREIEESNNYVEKISIKTPSINQKLKNLSGGNQQKVSIAKSLLTNPKILILDEPTRGVDVGAKKEIYDLINVFKKEGMSIIMISSEIPEILGMCDRVMVMSEGKIAGFINRKNANSENIIKLAIGYKEENNEA